MSDPRPPLSFGRRIAAAVGILIMTLTGGCTLYLFGGAFSNGQISSLDKGMLGIVFIFGGVPFGVGLLIFLAAVYGRRR